MDGPMVGICNIRMNDEISQNYFGPQMTPVIIAVVYLEFSFEGVMATW